MKYGEREGRREVGREGERGKGNKGGGKEGKGNIIIFPSLLLGKEKIKEAKSKILKRNERISQTDDGNNDQR